ncbi:EAL domain-containing protein [Thermincola ferriacetica]
MSSIESDITNELHNLISRNKNRILKRVLHFAEKHDYLKHTHTLETTWRKSVASLNDAIFKALGCTNSLFAMNLSTDLSTDVLSAFGTKEGKKHRERGVTLQMFLGLLKHCRISYEELITDAELEPGLKEKCLVTLERVFDRLEIGVCTEWVESIQNEKIKYLTIFESLPNPVIILNSKNEIESYNHAAAETFGDLLMPSARGRKLLLDAFPWLEQEMKDFAAGTANQYFFEKELNSKTAKSYFEIKLMRMFDIGDKSRYTIVFFYDITERKMAEEAIKHQAYHDPLTGLPNRILFKDRLTQTLAQAKRSKQMLALMFLDLDRFKNINDTLGHATGDQFLQGISKRLTGCIRSGDTVARLGGDEFTLLLPQINHVEDAIKVAQKIIDTFKKPWILGGHEFYITTSIGIALYPNDGEDAETLMKHADTAMYRAKERGNNYQLYSPSMNEKAINRLEMEGALRKALEREEFTVYYQPQINTDTGEIIGMEALVRWRHPERGIIPPADFIALAEETGLILPLGEWVLRTACRQNKKWQMAGYPPLRVTVNLSASQFQQQDLADRVSRILKETGLDPQWLELEITESIAMKDVAFTIKTLRQLRDMGIKIAIDDFGTGYSSLSYLKQIPSHTLKIDKSFVRDIAKNTEDGSIASAIIAMAQNLKLKVIAEGVETEEQLAFLKKQKCDEIQGFLFGKPVPPQEFEKLLKKKK